MKTTDEKLKPCPFCGGEDIGRTEYRPTKEITYLCVTCMAAITRTRGSSPSAMEAWNTRSTDTSLLDRALAAEGALNEAIALMTRYAREAGEAKGRLEMSEAAGIVDGWRERTLAAEARVLGLESLVVAVETFVCAYRARYLTGHRGVRANAPMRTEVAALNAVWADARALLSPAVGVEGLGSASPQSDRSEPRGTLPTNDGCDWPPGATFGFHDDPGEHDPCYVIMPGGAMLVFNHSATPGVDVARARFVQAACNAGLRPFASDSSCQSEKDT